MPAGDRDAGPDPDDDRILDIAAYRNPESGLYTAHVSRSYPMTVKAYALAEVFKAIWDRLAAQDAPGRFASEFVVESTHRYLREDHDRMQAELSEFASALSRIGDPDHPHGSPATLDEARDMAKLAFTDARRAQRARRTAWRQGALAQTEASTDRDLLHALCSAVTTLLPLLDPDVAQDAPGELALGRLRAALAACENRV